MAVPTIPSAISLGHIRVEFQPAGSNTNIRINDYYAGGGNVASGTANATSVSIPASGQIAFSNFSGASNLPPVLVKAFSNDAETLSNKTVTGGCSWNTSNGNWVATSSDTLTCNISYPYPWLNSGSNTSYDVRWTKTAGTGSFTSGNNTWQQLGTTRTCAVSSLVKSFKTVTCTMEIKYNANSTVISSNTCSISASSI